MLVVSIETFASIFSLIVVASARREDDRNGGSYEEREPLE